MVLAMHLCGDAFTPAQKARNVAYYEARTVRDSSLSACPQAVLTAEVGALDLAYDYLAECALTNLHDVHHNVSSGLHIASLAGAWTALDLTHHGERFTVTAGSNRHPIGAHGSRTTAEFFHTRSSTGLACVQALAA